MLGQRYLPLIKKALVVRTVDCVHVGMLYLGYVLSGGGEEEVLRVDGNRAQVPATRGAGSGV